MNKITFIILILGLNYAVNAQVLVSTGNSSGTYFQDKEVAYDALQSSYYVLKIGNLPYPKLIIQDLYSVFKVNPTYKDTPNGLYFEFYSKKDISMEYLNSFLISKNFTLDYFKKTRSDKEQINAQ